MVHYPYFILFIILQYYNGRVFLIHNKLSENGPGDRNKVLKAYLELTIL